MIPAAAEGALGESVPGRLSGRPGSIVRMITKLPAPTRELGADQARRIAIAAQQLAEPAPADRPVPVNRGHLSRLVRTIGLLQIDSVNVLARSHLIPVYSRLGGYPETVLEVARLARPVRGPGPARVLGARRVLDPDEPAASAALAAGRHARADGAARRPAQPRSPRSVRPAARADR